MEAKAQARYVRVTPQKARRVVDLVRGQAGDRGRRGAEVRAAGRGRPTCARSSQRPSQTRGFKADQAGERFDERELVVTRRSSTRARR